MTKGKVRRIIRDRGFGFIDAEDGREIFFHSSELSEGAFGSLQEGQEVEFEVEKGRRGPRAIAIRLIK